MAGADVDGEFTAYAAAPLTPVGISANSSTVRIGGVTAQYCETAGGGSPSGWTTDVIG